MINPLAILAATSAGPSNSTTGQGTHEINYVGGATSGDDLVANITNIINGVIAALGIVAVIIIIIGGVSYMTSSGDAARLKKAKDTILYACIGLVISVLSFAIVNFTISIIGSNGSGSTSGGGSGSGSSAPHGDGGDFDYIYDN